MSSQRCLRDVRARRLSGDVDRVDRRPHQHTFVNNVAYQRHLEIILLTFLSFAVSSCAESPSKFVIKIICWKIPCNKKAQLSLTNLRDAKACQKLLEFDVLTTLSLKILVYLHSFSCCCVRNLRNPAKLTENSNLWSSGSSKVIDLGVNGKPMYDFLLVTNSNFGRIC